MNKAIQLLAILTAIALLSGCIIVPVGFLYDEKFEELQASIFGSGAATREDVLFAFGSPDATYVNNQYFHYRVSKTMLVVGVATYGGGDGAELRQFQWLLVEFDEQARVVGHYAAEHIEGRKPCFSNGICVEVVSGSYVLVYSAERSAAEVKDLTSSACAVYYFEERKHSGGQIYMDDMRFRPAPKNAFYVWSLPEGKHVLKRTHSSWQDAEQEFDCRLGAEYYYVLRLERWRLFKSDKREAHLELVDPESGRAALMGRRLMVN